MIRKNQMAQEQLLDFISNDQLYGFVRLMVDAVENARGRVERRPHSAVIDPFSAIVDASIQGISLDQWMQQENARRIQKALQNAIGAFHQNVLGAMPGWENAGLGGSYDVRNPEKKIIAEIKNKYNTLNAGGYVNMYNTLASHLDYGDKGFTAYYVAIVTKTPNPYDKVFTPPKMGTRMPARENLRMIDGKSFYTLASGDPNALCKLYNALPLAISYVLGRSSVTGVETYDEVLAKFNDTKTFISDGSIKASACAPAYMQLFQRAFGR